MTLSGSNWVSQFPTSTDIGALDKTFGAKVTEFYDALRTAGAQVKITATLRPRQRAYLMHYSWCIWKHWQGVTPQNVPAFVPNDGEQAVDIQWVHYDTNGNPDKIASLNGANAMVVGYGMAHLGVPPALDSTHVIGKAIDMVIAWEQNLSIAQKNGQIKIVSSLPRDGTNPDLIDVGRTYEVYHLIDVMADTVHWSYNGH